MTERVTIRDARALGAIVQAAWRHELVAWLNDDSPDGITWGTARSIDDVHGNHASSTTGDIRDCYLRVTTSAGWDAFLSIRDLVRDAQTGVFVTDYRHHPEPT